MENKIRGRLLFQHRKLLPVIVIFVSLSSLFIVLKYAYFLNPSILSIWLILLLGVSAFSILINRRSNDLQSDGAYGRAVAGNAVSLSLLGLSLCFLYFFLYPGLEGMDKQNAAIAFIVIQIVVTFLASSLYGAALCWLILISLFSVFLNVMDGSPLLSANALLPLLLSFIIYLPTRYVNIMFRRNFENQIQNSERSAWLRMLIEQSPLSIVITDMKGRIIQVNRKTEEVAGYPAQELIGQYPSIFQSGKTDRRIYDLMWENILKGERWQGEFINKRKNGEIYTEWASISPVMDSTGHIQTIMGIKEDITQRKRAQKTILRQNGIIKMLLQDFEEQSESWLWETDENLVLRYVSDKIIRLFSGGILNKTIGDVLRQLAVPDDGEGERLLAEFLDALGRGEAFSEREVKILFEGEVLWLGLKALPTLSPEKRTGWRGVGRFITERKRMEAELYNKANYDEQSGLPNRFLIKRLISENLSADRELHRGIVGVVHVKELSKVRSDFGTLRYDGIVASLTEILRTALKEDFLLGRLNEDEFLFWLNESENNREERIDHLADRINSPIKFGDETYRFDVNVGLAYYPDDGGTQKDLFRTADLALKKAVENPQRKVMRYRKSFSEDFQKRMMILSDFHPALAAEQFCLYYQPQAHAGDGAMKGAEALVRWNHPLLGLVSPGEFIPLAEKSRFILELGEWILRRACRDAAGWGEEMTLSVNLSAVQLQDTERLKSVIREALDRSGFPPRRLILEITESALLSDMGESKDFLHDLQAMGVKIALDDFGTGYSSLAYLSQLSVDELKIDQSFIRKLGEEPGNREIVRTIIELARTFRFSLVAEGVETEEQRDLLRELGCDYIQGYLIGKPVPLKQLFE